MTRARPPADAPPVLLVTGLSGAGKSTALKALEDLGYEAVDNLPLSLLRPLLRGDTGRLAIGIDARTRAFTPEKVLETVAACAAEGRSIRILYLDCNDAELIRRFSETRRRHPLAQDRPAIDGIGLERELLAELHRAADVVIDTSDLGLNDLRHAIAVRFARPGNRPFTLTVISFGYARGVPRDADLVFDMRFLRNPHWVPELRPLTGTDPAVRRYVLDDPEFHPAFQSMLGLLSQLLPGYAKEGRAYLTIAFGCTGGKHRSVATADAMGAALRQAGWPNMVVHRDRVGAAQDAPDAAGQDGKEGESR